MIFWIFVCAITIIVFIALFFTTAVKSSDIENIDENIATPILRDAQTSSHFKSQLLEIEADLSNGLISHDEAQGAKSELARELLRLQADVKSVIKPKLKLSNVEVFISLVFIGLLSFGIYYIYGKPTLPAQPLALREMPASPNLSLEQAVLKVEAQLKKNPDDARAWSVIAPVYMQQERFDEAVFAYRKVLELLPISADAQTDLAEALMMASDGVADGEPIELLKSATKLDKEHVRSRFYLASELTRAGSNEEAIEIWQSLLALSAGDESWLEVAQGGLEAAQAGLRDEAKIQPDQTGLDIKNDEGQAKLILDMVAALSLRLETDGGSVEEWTRLTRSYLVLGEKENAQKAFDSAKAAYSNENVREELNSLAAEAGLK